MWATMTVAIAVNLFMCAIVNAVPTQNDIAAGFQAAVHHQNIQTILMSIEERLRNLDNIYSMHLSSTLEEKLEQYQRKLESIDTKIIRLESLMMLNLDKISENISTKNFKDDITKTSLMKKIDAIYEGISHRLGYVERKFETGTIKIQSKLETTLTRLEKMDEGFTRRYEDIEIELSDAIAAIDDLKNGFSTIEDNIANNTNENFEVSLKEQMTLMESFNDKSNRALQILYENATEDFRRFEQKIERGLEGVQQTNKSLQNLRHELKEELNEYAIKVAEMNSENWKTGRMLQSKQSILESIMNSTKTEVQNGIRALMVLIGKINNKEPLLQSDQGVIDKLSEKIDSNFEKIFLAQDLFMDSCYRLQMDESQIESKISDILEKLMETFEKKTAIELKDIKNLEKLIKSHDSHVTRNLYQTGTHMVTIHEKMTKDHRQFETNLKQVIDHLNALFSLVQDTLTDENGSLSAKNVNIFLHDLNEVEKKITSLNKQGDILTNSVDEIRDMLENVHHQNSSQVINDYFKNISRIIEGMEAKVNTVYLYYYFNRSKIEAINQNLTQQLQELIKAIRAETPSDSGDVVTELSNNLSGLNDTKINPNREENSTQIIKDERIRKLITKVFGEKYQSEETGRSNNIADSNNCTTNFLKMIDTRAGFPYDSDSDNDTQMKTSQQQSTTSQSYNTRTPEMDHTTLKIQESEEYEDFDMNNLQQITV